MSGNKTAMETIMRVIEANQEHMKEGEYLEAMNALRDLHRNQEHDEDAIMRPMRETIKKDMKSLWVWICTPPEDDDSDHFYTSAQSKIEEYLDEDTITHLKEWREHYHIHEGKEFDFCDECGECLTCKNCDCDEEVETEEEEELDHLEEFPDHIRCCECECCITCGCCECLDADGSPAPVKCDGCSRWYHFLDPRLNFSAEGDAMCQSCTIDSHFAAKAAEEEDDDEDKYVCGVCGKTEPKDVEWDVGPMEDFRGDVICPSCQKKHEEED